MPDMLWAAAGLLLMLPGDMQPVAVKAEKIPVLGLYPPALGHMDQLFCSWSNDKGASVVLHWWNAPQPPRDFGPISPEEKWNTLIGSQPLSAARTDLFMGRRQEVLVTWLPLEEYGASAMLHATGLSRESFDLMLKKSRIVDAGRTLSMTCQAMSEGTK